MENSTAKEIPLPWKWLGLLAQATHSILYLWSPVSLLEYISGLTGIYFLCYRVKIHVLTQSIFDFFKQFWKIFSWTYLQLCLLLLWFSSSRTLRICSLLSVNRDITHIFLLMERPRLFCSYPIGPHLVTWPEPNARGGYRHQGSYERKGRYLWVTNSNLLTCSPRFPPKSLISSKRQSQTLCWFKPGLAVTWGTLAIKGAGMWMQPRALWPETS